MRKILFHLNCFEQGGTERVVSNLANQLVKEDYEVVAATEWQGETEFWLDGRVKRIHVGLRGADEGKNRIIKAWLRIKYLRELIRKERPDVVISFTRKPNYRALVSAMGTGIPVIPAVRQDPGSYYNSLSDKFLMPLLYPMAAGCVFQTPDQRESFLPSVQKKSRVIWNPVHHKYLNVPEPEKREKSVVQSGRLVGFKNQAMLFRAFLKVHEKHPDYVLKLYGGDSFDGTKEKLEAIIKENKAEAYIQLMGASDCLEKELPKASVYAFSSDYEGMPNALLEAMVLGLPIVAADCSGGAARILIEHEKNGLLIPPGDEKAMADAISRLIEDGALAGRLGAQARKISEKVNEAAVLGQWKEYVEEVIAEGKR